MMPAGIEEGIELYKHNDKIRVMVEGVRMDYHNLPEEIRSIFREEMSTDNKVMAQLKEMGISDSEEMERTFVGCRYGTLDSMPDLIGVKTYPDAPNCVSINKCQGYGIICKIPGNLTKQEYLVALYIVKGKQDKEICDSMQIAVPTLRTYMSRIHEKLNVNNRIEIALWMQNLGI
jgi:DNA-binding NarL/FixJ family response regulator